MQWHYHHQQQHQQQHNHPGRYIWTALRQRARVYDWATVGCSDICNHVFVLNHVAVQVQALTETKAMFGAKVRNNIRGMPPGQCLSRAQDKSPFGFVPFVEEICKNNGPETLANK